jgi:dihydrofolate reductase/thymidylate synthase
MKKFNIILACDLAGGIGYNNNLPWDFALDKKYFKTLTTNFFTNIKNILIMGKNTYRIFNNRESYVVSTTLKNDITTGKNVITTTETNINNIYDSFSKAYDDAILNEGDIWVIGGSRLYECAIKHFACDKIYLTLINGIFNCDIYFNINKYQIEWTSNISHQNDISAQKAEILFSRTKAHCAFVVQNDINRLDNKNYELIFKIGNVIPNVETQYLNTLYDVLYNGDERVTRNGITLSKFNKTLSFDLQKGFPLLTTKKMFWKGIVEELLFFIRGDTDTKLLSNKGVKIWEPNTSKEFLNKMNLDYEEGLMGPMYGYQWRFFNKNYRRFFNKNYRRFFNKNYSNNDNNFIDQLKKVIDEIKNDPMSRRILMTTFNPLQVELGVLYPCHSIIIQFYVEKNENNNNYLCCSMYQRSCDLFLGLPFNIASTSLLLHIVASLTNTIPGTVNIILGDYHIYSEHKEQVLTQLSREPYSLCELVMPNFNTLEDVEKSKFEDYKIYNYEHHPAIKANMIA